MSTVQQGDVNLFQTDDNGDIRVIDGITEMVPGLEVSAYLALFGGNEEDDGSDGNPLQWWGNFEETIEARKYRSETQYLLRSLPATSANRAKLESAVLRDLDYLLSEKIASSVEVVVTIPKLNTVNIAIDIEAVGEEQNFNFTENWKASL